MAGFDWRVAVAALLLLFSNDVWKAFNKAVDTATTSAKSKPELVRMHVKFLALV